MPGAVRLDGDIYLVFTYIWREDVAKIPKYYGSVPSLRGARGDRAPLTTACDPISVYLECFFEASRND